MKKKEIERKIILAIKNDTPDIYNNVLLSCSSQEKITAPKANVKKPSSKRKAFLFPAFACIVCILLLSFGLVSYKARYQAESLVSIDVNPSIELIANNKDRVLKVHALNQDAEKILEGMNLENTDLTVAVNAIIGSMVKNGYLDNFQNAVLISVENKDSQKSAILKEKLASNVNDFLLNDAIDAAIYGQVLTEDTELHKFAEKYAISHGKAKLIDQLAKADATLSMDTLAGLTVYELSLLADAKIEKKEELHTYGTLNTSSYLDSEEAIQIALSHAGISKEEVQKIEAELDYENGYVVYEIEFETKDAEYEYDLDAKTGRVIKFESNKEDIRPSSASPAPTNTTTGISPGLTADQAKSIALSKAPEAKILKIEFDEDTDDANPHYEIELINGSLEIDCEIDAVTGVITKWEEDYD